MHGHFGILCIMLAYYCLATGVHPWLAARHHIARQGILEYSLMSLKDAARLRQGESRSEVQSALAIQAPAQTAACNTLVFHCRSSRQRDRSCAGHRVSGIGYCC